MAKIKILNDPLYGLISFPFEIIYDLIDHPYFQRLRRIAQLGLTSYVYPGATHTRFHHAIGATHLCDRLINTLRLKNIAISDDEHEACMIATLLHDIGHGPFSHALERQIIDKDHEDLTILIMQRLNDVYEGRLSLALKIFQKKYHKNFLTQIISSQLDVDRMDYLNRDSFYTGVTEGIIGYDRIIKMMNVLDGDLVVEEKGIHSVEKFLISRHLMYHQVYLHKASISAEQMLKAFIKNVKYVGVEKNQISSNLNILLNPNISSSDDEKLTAFLLIDDYDVYQLLKESVQTSNKVKKILANGILNRNLFKTILKDEPFDTYYKNALFVKCSAQMGLNTLESKNIVIFGIEENSLYKDEDEIIFLTKKSSDKVTLSKLTRLKYHKAQSRYHFVTFPKGIS